jgi:GTPase SAR1 family protein
MPKNAQEVTLDNRHRLLVVGPTGSGKSTQIWTLPGRKFAYVFDPNTMPTIRGCNVDYEEFFPEFLEMDTTLKGFNRGAKSDRPKKPKEPTVYLDWGNNINEKVESGFFNNYDWLIIDSVTFLSKAAMDRTLYLNGRYGDLEDRADYRVVGSKLSDIFNAISGLPINVYCTGHIRAFQDDKTQKIITQINLPGKSREVLPLMFTNVWLSKTEEDEDGKVRYMVRTKPETRGFQDIRSCIQGLETEEDVTIKSFNQLVPGSSGIGALLRRAEATERKENVHALHQSRPK